MHRTAGIIGHIVFYMMHTHVVAEITFGGMTKYRADYPGNIGQ